MFPAPAPPFLNDFLLYNHINKTYYTLNFIKYYNKYSTPLMPVPDLRSYGWGSSGTPFYFGLEVFLSFSLSLLPLYSF